MQDFTSNFTSKTTLSVRLIIEREGSFLVLQRKKRRGGGLSLIGGKVDKGENIWQAIVRESKEEADIAISQEFLEIAHIQRRFRKQKKLLVFFFKLHQPIDYYKILEKNKFKKAIWANMEELKSQISEPSRLALDAFWNGENYSEFREVKKQQASQPFLSFKIKNLPYQN